MAENFSGSEGPKENFLKQTMTRREFMRKALKALGLAGLAGGALYGAGTYLENEAKKKDEISVPPSATPEPTVPPTTSPTARPTETPALTETPTAKEASPKELLLQLGHHYSFSHPAFSFEVELTTQDNFNNKRYCGERRFRVACFQGNDKIIPGNFDWETVLNLHSDYYNKKERLAGSTLLEEIHKGNLKTGDEIVMVDREAQKTAKIVYLGSSEPIPANLFEGETWSKESMKIAAGQKNSPAYEAKKAGKDLVVILTCNPPSNILGNYSHKMVLSFVIAE